MSNQPRNPALRGLTRSELEARGHTAAPARNSLPDILTRRNRRKEAKRKIRELLEGGTTIGDSGIVRIN